MRTNTVLIPGGGTEVESTDPPRKERKGRKGRKERKGPKARKARKERKLRNPRNGPLALIPLGLSKFVH